MNEASLQRLADAAKDPHRSRVELERQDGFELFLMGLYVRVGEINDVLKNMYSDPNVPPRTLIEYADGVAAELNKEYELAGMEVGLVGEVLIPMKTETTGNDYSIYLQKEPINAARTLHDLAVIQRVEDEEGDNLGPQIGLRFVQGQSNIRYFEGTVLGMAELSKVMIFDQGSFGYEMEKRDVATAVDTANMAINEIRIETEVNRKPLNERHREYAAQVLSNLYAIIPPAISPSQIFVSDGHVPHMYLFNKEQGSLYRKYSKEGAGRSIATGRLEVIGFKLPAVLESGDETEGLDQTSLEDGIGIIVRYDKDEDCIAVLPTAGHGYGKLTIE